MRVETDLIGTKEIDQDAYYGLQTLRAYENFNITGRRAHPEFIRSLAAVKRLRPLPTARLASCPKREGTQLCRHVTKFWRESYMMLLLPILSRAAQAPLLI